MEKFRFLECRLDGELVIIKLNVFFFFKFGYNRDIDFTKKLCVFLRQIEFDLDVDKSILNYVDYFNKVVQVSASARALGRYLVSGYVVFLFCVYRIFEDVYRNKSICFKNI